MLKNEWEKTQTRVTLEDDVLQCMMNQAMPDRPDYMLEVISGGAANLNYKIMFKNNDPAYILRVYIRDPESVYRERKIAQLLLHKYADVPMAKYLYVGDCQGYRFALVEFMQGVTLRHVLLHGDAHEWQAPVYAAGKMLAHVGKITFSQAGFFNTELEVTKPFKGTEIDVILQEPIAHERLGNERVKAIQEVFLRHKDLLPDASQHQLVHGDFDPSNMLVEKHEGVWRITALLDWEFAFSGSYLWDVSNMLRYAHKLHATYQQSFVRGLQDAGVKLPENFEHITHLLNLISLIEAVKRGDPEKSPKQYADMYELIDYQIQQLR